MVLGTIWSVSASKPHSVEARCITEWEPIRTMTPERLDEIKSKECLEFEDEILTESEEHSDKEWLNVDVEIITDKNYSQFGFDVEIEQDEFIKWCEGNEQLISNNENYIYEDVREYLQKAGKPVRLRVLLEHSSCAPNWLFDEKEWDTYYKEWCGEGKYPYKVYRDYSSKHYWERRK